MFLAWWIKVILLGDKIVTYYVNDSLFCFILSNRLYFREASYTEGFFVQIRQKLPEEILNFNLCAEDIPQKLR